ncbi:MAG: response regulator [Myxococcota bacterium]
MQSAAEPTDTGGGGALRVLVVDDDPIVLEVARERLERMGHQVTTRDRSLGTTQAILADPPDCILLDVMMPGLSGDALAELLRKQKRTREIAIILHSSKSSDDLWELIRTTGALGAIEKTSDDARFEAQFQRLTRRITAKDDAT